MDYRPLLKAAGDDEELRALVYDQRRDDTDRQAGQRPGDHRGPAWTEAQPLGHGATDATEQAKPPRGRNAVAVRAVTDGLTGKAREAYDLVYVRGLSTRQAADLLGVSHATISARLSRTVYPEVRAVESALDFREDYIPPASNGPLRKLDGPPTEDYPEGTPGYDRDEMYWPRSRWWPSDPMEVWADAGFVSPGPVPKPPASGAFSPFEAKRAARVHKDPDFWSAILGSGPKPRRDTWSIESLEHVKGRMRVQDA